MTSRSPKKTKTVGGWTPSENLRLFCAIDLPQGVRKQIGACVQTFEKCGADVRWTPVENMHLTLKFFGQVPQERLAGIEAGFQEAAALTRPFAIGLDGGFDAFPDFRAPKIIWMGVREGAHAFSDLARRVEDKMQALGFARETNEFVAHLTIGRVRSTRGSEKLRNAISSTKLDLGESFEASSLRLYESRTLPAGAFYRPLGSYPFSDELGKAAVEG